MSSDEELENQNFRENQSSLTTQTAQTATSSKGGSVDSFPYCGENSDTGIGQLQRRTEDNDNNNRSSSEPDSSTDSPLKRARKSSAPKKYMKVDEEIKMLESSTNLLIPRAPFSRLVREIVQNQKSEMRVSKMAVEALQESSEMFISNLFQDSMLVATHRKAITVEPRDLSLVQILHRN